MSRNMAWVCKSWKHEAGRRQKGMQSQIPSKRLRKSVLSQGVNANVARLLFKIRGGLRHSATSRKDIGPNKSV